MFVLNMAVGGEMASWGLQSFWNLAKTSIKNKLGQKVFGAVATSPFGDYESEYKAALGGEQIEQTTPQKVLMFVKNYLTAWGYLAIIPGGLIKWAKSKIFPSTTVDATGSAHQSEGSIFGTVLATIGNILFYGGPVAAFIGQILPFQRQFALGEKKQMEMQKALMEKEIERDSDKKMFEELNVQEKIHQPADKLKKVLTYSSKIEASIFNRSDTEDIETAFIYGPTGTGKSAGATVILSEWARKKVEKDDHIPKILKLDLTVLESCAEKLKSKVLEKAEFFGAMGKDLGDLVKQDVGDPLMVFELFISTMEDEIKAVNEHNKKVKTSGDAQEKEQRLALFIDEFDKIGKMARTSTDPNRLTKVLARLYKLLEQNKVPVILTSNRSLKQIRMDLESVMPEDLWETTIDPLIRRLGMSNIQLFIDDPASKEQAEILAKYLLDAFDSETLNITYGNEKIEFTGNRLKDIESLRNPLLDQIANCPGSCMLNGSYLEGIVKTSKRILSSLADKFRGKEELIDSKRMNYTDEEWSHLSSKEKTRLTGVRLDITRLKKLCEEEQAARIRDMSRNDDHFAVKLNDSIASNIVKSFMGQKKDSLERNLPDLFTGKLTDERVLKFLSTVYQVEGGVYSSYDDVLVKIGDEEKSYKHAIVVDKGRKVVQIGFVPAGNSSVRTAKGFASLDGMKLSTEIPLDRFVADCMEEITKVFGKPQKGRSILQMFREIADGLRSGEGFDMDEISDLKGIFDAFGLKGAPV